MRRIDYDTGQYQDYAGTRSELLDRLAVAIESVPAAHPVRVAVDGPPAAGKTTLADELAVVLRARDREVIRASTESFHLPRAQRYRRGEFSPEANYHDSFDYDTLRRVLLDPLGPDGDRRYQAAVYNWHTDTSFSHLYLLSLYWALCTLTTVGSVARDE